MALAEVKPGLVTIVRDFCIIGVSISPLPPGQRWRRYAKALDLRHNGIDPDFSIAGFSCCAFRKADNSVLARRVSGELR